MFERLKAIQLWSFLLLLRIIIIVIKDSVYCVLCCSFFVHVGKVSGRSANLWLAGGDFHDRSRKVRGRNGTGRERRKGPFFVKTRLFSLKIMILIPVGYFILMYFFRCFALWPVVRRGREREKERREEEEKKKKKKKKKS